MKRIFFYIILMLSFCAIPASAFQLITGRVVSEVVGPYCTSCTGTTGAMVEQVLNKKLEKEDFAFHIFRTPSFWQSPNLSLVKTLKDFLQLRWLSPPATISVA